MSNSICSCLVLSPLPPKTCNGDCIYAPNLLVGDQVTACAGATDIDISPITIKCAGVTPKFSIVSSKNVTGTPTITPTKITFVPANNNYATAEIVYKVSCGILSAVGKVIIVYKNLCIDVACDNTKICNKCTGLCEPIPGDITIGKTATTQSGSSGLIIG